MGNPVWVAFVFSTTSVLTKYDFWSIIKKYSYGKEACKGLSVIMKKVLCIAAAIVAFVAVLFALRKETKAYPYMYPGNMPECIPVSSEMPLSFRLYREYTAERVTAKVYSGKDTEGKEPIAVFSKEYNEKNESMCDVRFAWSTPDIPGDYTVEYYTGFYADGTWYDSDKHSTFDFSVVYPCEEEHTFVEKKDSVYGAKGVEADCYTKGISYKLCSECGYEEMCELDYLHVYNGSKTVSNATCSSVGYKTYKCVECEETKVEIIEADTDKHSIRAVVKVEATATRPGSVWFECAYCNYVEPYKTELPALFMEIAPGLYYEKPVIWAYDKGVFDKIKGYTFDPNAECDKARVMTLIYLLNGKGVLPEDANPFTDVPEGAYFRDAAKWAYKYGVVEGEKFEPYKVCTRGMLVEYLWKMAGSPNVRANHDFADVPEDASYSKAVSWAVSEGIASGMDEGIFDPDRNCTQAQVITFLYRVLNEEAED